MGALTCESWQSATCRRCRLIARVEALRVEACEAGDPDAGEVLQDALTLLAGEGVQRGAGVPLARSRG